MGNNVKIKYSTIISIILIFVILPPNYFFSFSAFVQINQITVLVIFFLLLIFTLIKRRLNLYICLTIIFLSWNSLNSFFILEGVLDLYNNLRILSIVLLINLMVKNHILSLLKAFYIVFSIYIALNFITYIAFPNGLYLDNPREGQFREAWFLGIENQFAYFLIPGIILILIYELYEYKRITFRGWGILIITTFTIIISWSATAVVAYMFLIISLLIVSHKYLRKIYNFFSLLIIYIVLWFITMRINSLFFFQKFVEDFLEKDLTLSSRTVIWERVFEYINLSKWLGHGNNTYVAFTAKEYRAHNLILQIILDNGLISLGLLILIIILVGYRFKYNTNITYFIMIGIFSILIGSLTESYRMNHLFLLLSLGYFSKDIIKNLNKYNRVKEIEGFDYEKNYS